MLLCIAVFYPFLQHVASTVSALEYDSDRNSPDFAEGW